MSGSIDTITYTTSIAEPDLTGIIHLQRKNLPGALTAAELNSEGFVTVIHSYEDLSKLNDIEKHVIAKVGEEVVAYLLAMTEHSKFDIPGLRPMFEMFSKVTFAGRMVSDFNYIVVGQVCVSKDYRSIGVLDNCYAFYKETYKNKYDFAITEIDSSNPRSLNAHKRIGFKEVYRYQAPDGKEWVIVLWDWNEIGLNFDLINKINVQT